MEKEACQTQYKCLAIGKYHPIAGSLGWWNGAVDNGALGLMVVVHTTVQIFKMSMLINSDFAFETTPHQWISLWKVLHKNHCQQSRCANDQEAVLDVWIEGIRSHSSQNGSHYTSNVSPENVGGHYVVKMHWSETGQCQRRKTRTDERSSNTLYDFGDENQHVIRISIMNQQNCRSGNSSENGGCGQKDPSIHRSFVNNVSSYCLDKQGCQTHQRQSQTHRSFIPTNSDQVNALKDVEPVSQLAQTERYQSKGHLRRQPF
mmetsp:Transcript_19998/g.34161  ORF Transcript_19998/g.34161 Transcript_19998/m.34161 type:complete len:260 (-) Transcript_19998:14-793(-)